MFIGSPEETIAYAFIYHLYFFETSEFLEEFSVFKEFFNLLNIILLVAK